MFKYVRFTPMTDEHTTHAFNEIDDRCKVHRFDVPYVSVEYKNEADFTELVAAQNSIIEAIEITQAELYDIVQHSDQVKRMYNVANEHYQKLMMPITSIYTQEERDTWMSQYDQSLEYMDTKDESIAPMIVTLAAGDGLTTEEYASLILTRKSEFDAYSASALSEKRIMLYALKAEVGL